MFSSKWLKCFSSHPFASWLICLGFCRIFVFVYLLLFYFSFIFDNSHAKKCKMQSQPSFHSLLPTVTKDTIILSLNFCVYFEKFSSNVPFLPVFNWVLRFIYSFLLPWIYYHIPIFWNTITSTYFLQFLECLFICSLFAFLKLWVWCYPFY